MRVVLATVSFVCLGVVALYCSFVSVRHYHTLATIIFLYLLFWSLVFLWSNACRSENATHFLLTGAAVSLTVACLELVVVTKVADFRHVFNTPVMEPWQHPDNLLDPKLLHIHKPYDHWVWVGTDYRYDQYGLRNETDLTAAHVVVVGDSFVEGYGVRPSDMLTSHLSTQLDRSVANLGQSYYGPQQELELLRRYGLSLNPKVCVWIFFEGNDLDDLRRYKRATKDWESFSKNLHSFRQRSFTRNAIFAVDRLLDSSPSPLISRLEREQSGLFKQSSGQMTRLIFSYKGHHLSSSDYSAIEELRAILGEACSLCHARGAQFLVVFAPDKFRVYKEFTEFDAQVKPRYWVINPLPNEIEKIVRQDLSGAGFLDLTNVFVGRARQGRLLYFDYDTHWSPEGHWIAASAIADFIRNWK